jgi:hypothetical protein
VIDMAVVKWGRKKATDMSKRSPISFDCLIVFACGLFDRIELVLSH